MSVKRACILEARTQDVAHMNEHVSEAKKTKRFELKRPSYATGMERSIYLLTHTYSQTLHNSHLLNIQSVFQNIRLSNRKSLKVQL